MIEKLIDIVNSIILKIGYPGIFILMFFESTMLPIPSEIVLPFAGYLAAQGHFSFWLVVIVSGVAGLCGSLASYAIGYYGGIPLIKRWGKYALLDECRLAWTQNWFKKRGEVTIFISRFIPVVRHLISLPAGVGKMNLAKFSIFTFVGATLWSLFLTYLGYLFGENYLIIHEYSKPLDYIVLALLIVGIGYYIWHFMHLRKKNKVCDTKLR